MFVSEGSAHLKYCTVSGNRAEVYGGGIAGWWNSDITISSCILWNNAAAHGSEQALASESNPSRISFEYSDIKDGPSTTYQEAGCLINWKLGNIHVEPEFVQPGYWQNDTWIGGNYHLKSSGWRWDSDGGVWTYDQVTSRCIDAGNPGAALADETAAVDLDPYNLFGSNLRVNMGAYGGTSRASIGPYDWALLGDLTNDGIVNLDDFAAQEADWLTVAEELPGDLDRNDRVDFTDLQSLVYDWLISTTWSTP